MARWRPADSARAAGGWWLRILSAALAPGGWLASDGGADTVATRPAGGGLLSKSYPLAACRLARWLPAPVSYGGSGVASGGGGRHSCGPSSRGRAGSGGELAVQGVSLRRWRCGPAVQESSIYGGIRGVEAVEAGGSGGVSAGGGWPGSCRLRWPLVLAIHSKKRRNSAY